MVNSNGQGKELPTGWVYQIFSDLVYTISINHKKVKQKEYLTSGAIPIIDQGQKFIGGFTDDNSKIIDFNLPVIVFGDHTRIVKLVKIPFAPGADGVKVIKPIEVITPEFLTYFTRILANKIPNKGYARHFQFLEKSIVFIPPQRTTSHSRQNRRTFSDLDAGIENLKTAQAQLKIYRQSVLKWAFEGKLTAKWRKLNKNQFTTVKLPIEKITDDRVAELPLLPANWTWSESGYLFDMVTSGSRGWAKYYSEAGALFIRIGNLDFDSLKLDLTNLQYVTPPEGAEGKRTKIEEGDFLFSIIGYLGMFAIAPKIDEAYVNQHIALVRPQKWFNRKYVGYYIISKSGGYYYLNKLTKGAVKAGLRLDDIKSFPVPICSEEEQNQIVLEIESRLSICDSLETTITENLQRSEALRQSVF